MIWREMVGDAWLKWAGANRGIVLAVWWNIALLVLSVAALPFDQRKILGLNPWIKPIKFEISVIVFLLTMAALLAGLGRRGNWAGARQWMAWGFGVAMIAENTIIAMQSLRGVRSHMNYTSLFNGVSFGIMGVFIALNTLLVAVLLVLFLITRTGLPLAVTSGAVLGLAVLLAGSVEGSLMVGRYVGHTVGAPDGGPGLPFVNWSTGHGDLRVAHFFAIHALQAFLLAGWAVSRAQAAEWLQVAAVFLFAAIYSGVVWILFQQAVRGEPFWAKGG